MRSDEDSRRTARSRVVQVAPWLWTALAVIVAFVFVRAAIEKLVGVPAALAPFNEIGWPLRAASMAATAEIMGAIALIVPRTRSLGALLLSSIMIGAAITNLVNGHPEYVWVNAALIAASLVLGWKAKRDTFSQSGSSRGQESSDS